MALERVAFLPFGLLIDKWRWDVFSGEVKKDKWTEHWWNLRKKYQKVEAPSERGEEFFDPGAKYHIPADSQYIAYFVAHILEFSFYKSLCIEADQYDPNNPTAKPLHKCDFYKNIKAGDKLKAGLELGLSEHWTVALEKLTGETEINAKALLEYFAPLQTFLKKQNDMSEVLDRYEDEASLMCNKMVKAEWDVATDSNSEAKQDVLAETVLEGARFSKEAFETNFKGIKPEDYTNELVQRQLKYLTILGRDVLDETDLNNVS
jgi:peptidyl-dipeptidase A